MRSMPGGCHISIPASLHSAVNKHGRSGYQAESSHRLYRAELLEDFSTKSSLPVGLSSKILRTHAFYYDERCH